jgi:hypothetical protein
MEGKGKKMMHHANRLVVCLAVVLAATGALLAEDVMEKGNIDELRFGTALDAEGVVPAKTHSSHFKTNDTIHVTMKTKDVSEGVPLMLSIFDSDTDKLVWSSKQELPGGRTMAHFVIPVGAIPLGEYKGKVKIGEDWVAEHEFKIE